MWRLRNAMFTTYACGKDESFLVSRKKLHFNTLKTGVLQTLSVCTLRQPGITHGGITGQGCLDATWDCASITYGSVSRSLKRTRELGLMWNRGSGKSLQIMRR